MIWSPKISHSNHFAWALEETTRLLIYRLPADAARVPLARIRDSDDLPESGLRMLATLPAPPRSRFHGSSAAAEVYGIHDYSKEATMGSTSRMLLVLSVLRIDSTFRHFGFAACPILRSRDRDHAPAGDRMPVARVAFQSGRTSARFSARWIGQDGHDYVGPNNQFKPSDVQDIHIELVGLDPRREVVFVEVTGYGGDQWQFSPSRPAGGPSSGEARGRGPPTCSSSRIASRRDGPSTSWSATTTGRRLKST